MIKNSRITYILVLLMMTAGSSFAQTVYRSVQSGEWNQASTWERSVNGGAWAAHTTYPTSSTDAIIRNEHTVTALTTHNCANLTIDAGGVLEPKVNTTATLKFGVHTVRGDYYLTNNGVIKSDIKKSATGGLLRLEVQNSAQTYTINGAGTTQLARLNARSGNTDLHIIIDANIDIVESLATPSFSAMDVTPANRFNTDAVTITIKENRKVTVTSPSYWHSAGNDVEAGGNYVYNIDGELNVLANTGAHLVAAKDNPASSTTVNVAGKLLMSPKFNTINSLDAGIEESRVKLNILGNGEVDASVTTDMTLGKSFFVIENNGTLKRTVNAAEEVEFPIGSSLTNYTPVSITNTGAVADVFSVSVKAGLTSPSINSDKSVNQQWSIVANGTTTPATVKFGWNASNEGAEFNRTAGLTIIKSGDNGTTWQDNLATASNASPLFFAAADFTSYGLFGVSNVGALPLKLLAFNAVTSASFSNEVSLKWTTSDEKNIMAFEVEKSVDGVSFTKVGAVQPKLGTGVNLYAFTDKNNAHEVVYYRLRIVDNDLKFALSNVVAVNNNNIVISAYPNPVNSVLTVTYPMVKSQGSLQVINTYGQVLENRTLSPNTVLTEVDMSAYKTGYYLIGLNNGVETKTIKVIKK